MGGGWWQWRRQRSPAEVSAVKLVNDVVSELHLGKRCKELRPDASFSGLYQSSWSDAAGEQRLHQPVQCVCVVLCVCLCVGAWVEEATLDALSLHSLAKAIASPSRPVNTAHWRTCTFIIKAHIHTCCSYTSCVFAMVVLWCISAH